MKNILMAFVMAGFLFVWPVASFADWNDHDGHSHDSGHHDSGHHDGGHHDHSYVGVGFTVLPNNYYYDPAYYSSYYPPDGVLVSPPPDEPVVVVPPVTVVQPPTVVDTQEQPQDSFTINIPNDKGGYTAVTLKRSGNGFIGPQGEFYTTFPTVAQLRVMYGK